MYLIPDGKYSGSNFCTKAVWFKRNCFWGRFCIETVKKKITFAKHHCLAAVFGREDMKSQSSKADVFYICTSLHCTEVFQITTLHQSIPKVANFHQQSSPTHLLMDVRRRPCLICLCVYFMGWRQPSYEAAIGCSILPINTISNTQLFLLFLAPTLAPTFRFFVQTNVG